MPKRLFKIFRGTEKEGSYQEYETRNSRGYGCA